MEIFQEIKEFGSLARQVDKEIEDAIAYLQKTPALTKADAEEMAQVMTTLATIEGEHQDFDNLAEKVFELLHEGKTAQARLLEEHVEKAEDELGR